MVLASVLQQLRAAPAVSDKTASFPARQRTVAVQESAWILLGMPLPAASAAKHSCATTAEVKISHWGPSHVEMPTPWGIPSPQSLHSTFRAWRLAGLPRGLPGCVGNAPLPSFISSARHVALVVTTINYRYFLRAKGEGVILNTSVMTAQAS